MKVEGYFMTFERANDAVAKLKEAGFNNSFVEIDDNNRNIQRNLADTNSSIRLANFTVDPWETKSAPLTSISPIINVRAGFSEFNDINYKIIVETEKSSTLKAKEIIKSLGGSFKQETESVGRAAEEVGELNEKFKKNDI